MTGRTGSSPAPRWDPDELGLAAARLVVRLLIPPGHRSTWRGFLSVQPARREEVLATATISATERYRATMRRLEQRVAACAAAYARDILPVPVAATA
jgi:hypothetical protein